MFVFKTSKKNSLENFLFIKYPTEKGRGLTLRKHIREVPKLITDYGMCLVEVQVLYNLLAKKEGTDQLSFRIQENVFYVMTWLTEF